MNIEIKNLCKSYGAVTTTPQDILSNINLSVDAGDFVTILGQSGSGKSTLLNMIAGLIPPSSGEILVDGQVITGSHPSIYIVFQHPCLLPWLTVEENIGFGCKLRRELDDLDYRVDQFVELIGLSSFKQHYPSELSMGMSYRVSLARALIGRPRILLIDEPFGALDIFTRSRLQEEMINIWMSEQFTAILVTHDIDEAILMGNKIILLGGKPCGVLDIVENDLDYPRKILDENFFYTKTTILNKLKMAFYEMQEIPE